MSRRSDPRLTVKVSAAHYPEESLRAGLNVLDGDVSMSLTGRGATRTVTLEWSDMGPRDLEVARGEFLNEALSHAYRQTLIKFNAELTAAVLGRFFAKSFPEIPPDPLEGLEPQVAEDRKAETEALIRTAQEKAS